MFTLGFSNLTTFLGVNTAPFAKTVTYPSTTQGRVLRVKDISGTTATAGSLMLSTTQGALFDGKVSTLLFSTNTNTFTSITAVADGASNWVIKSAYMDMLIRAPPQPTDVSGLQLWFDANTVRGSTGQQVFWFGNRLSTINAGRKSNEVFVATASNLGPLLQVSSLNGNNTLLFNNSNFNMRLSTVRTYDTMTFFAVSRLTNVTNARIWQGTQADIRYGYSSGRKNLLFMDNWVTDTQTNSNVTTVNSNWDLLTVNRDVQGNAELFNYGISRGRGIGFMGFQGLGINTGFAAEPSTAEIAEWILYNKKLSLGEQQRVEGYLAQKYGFTSQLPLTHPFTTQLASTLGAPSTISDIPNLRLWFDATQLRASNGQKISSLSNLVGTGEVFGSNSATSTTWATFSTNQLNGYPILDFANTQILFLQQPRKYPVFTMFAMTRMTPGGATARYLLQGTTWSTWYGYGNNLFGTWVKNYYVTDNNIEIRGTANTFTWDLYTFSRTNTAIARIATYGSNINRGFSQIGFEGLAINTGWDTTNTSACQFAEVLIYDRELGSEECSRVESYLAYKYNQASNLYIPQPAAQNLFLQTPQPVISTISTLSSITNLKFWYDATQIPLITPHRYVSLKQTTILPSNVSSLDCWYDASGANNFLTNFSSIVLWYDKGSNARHLAQATQSNQPSWDSNLNRVWFNGATQFLVFPTIPNVTSNAAFTIFMVEQRQAGTSWIFGGSNTGTNCNLFAGYNAAATYYVGFTGNDFSMYLDTTYTNNFTNQYEPYRIWTIQYGGLNRRFYINGTQILTQNGVSALTSWLGAALGRYTTNYYTGYMREFIIYSNALNERDRENIEGYLATKWGLQTNLTPYTPVSTMFNLASIGVNIIASNTSDHYWMPKLNYSSINGLNTLHFNVNNSMYQAQTIIYPTEFTMFTMARHSFFGAGVGCNSRSIFQGLTTGNTAYGYGQNVYGTWVKNYFTNDGNVETAGASVDSNWNLHRFQRNSNGIGSLAVWGSNMNRGYIQSGFEGLGIHFGTTFGNTVYSDCDIAEIIIYDRALDPKEAKDVESYLANKYALTSNLYVPVLATSNQFEVTPQPLLSTISTLSSITNLKFWYDATQIPVITQHPYMGVKQTTILPSNVSSLDCWFDVSGVNNFSTFGSSIAIWYDKGPNGRNLVQSTLSNEPTYDSVNNRLRFNGNTQFLPFTTIPNINTNVAFTVFMVEQRQTATTYAFGGSNTTTNTNLYAGYNTAINYYGGFYGNDFSMYTDSTFSNRNVSDEPYRIWSIRYDFSSNRSFYINGSLILSQTNIAPVTSWLGAALGRYTTNYYNGYMREFIIYSNAINDNDRQRIEGYLATKWGLQSNLTNYTPVSTMLNITQLGANMIASNSGDAYWMPKLNYSSINGLNVLRFNTSNSMFQSNVFIYPSEFTMFTLSRYIFANGFSNSRSIFQGLRTGATAYGYGTNVYGTWVKNYFTSDGNVEIMGTAVDGNWNLHRFQRNSVGIGSLAVWGSNMNRGYIQTGFEGLAINYGVTFGNTVYSDCDIAEIIIYDRFLTPAETSQVELYIANKFGLTSNLYVPLLATSNQFVSTPQPIISTVSTLSDITNLKYWFDPSQISFITHPYKTSTSSANISSITSISSLDCWFDASGVSNFSTAGSTISAWYDMGPNRRHLFQTTQSQMPFYVSSQNLVRFNAGSSHFLNFTTSPNIINSDYTVFVVEQRQTDTGYFIGGCNGATNQQFWMGYSNLVNASNNWNWAVQAHMNNDLYSTVDFISVRLAQEPYRIWSAQYGSNTQLRRTFINGLLYAYQNFTTDLQTWSNAYVGRNSFGYYTGNMREIIFYNRFLSDRERTQVEGYLARKWNLVSSLTAQTPISTLTNLTRLGADLVIPFGNTCNMPLLVTNPTLGNKNVLRFDTNRYMYQTTVRIYPVEYTIFTLSRHIAPFNGGYAPGLFSNRNNLTNSRTIFQGLITNALYGYGSGSNGYAKNYFINDGNVETFGTPVDSNWNLHRFQRQADGITSLWYFGSNVNRGYTQSGFEGLGINYGANSTSNNANSDCEVSEILIYDRNLTPVECTRVEHYLANKYGLSTTYVQMSTLNYASSIVANISSLSSLTGLKLWFDPSQMTYLKHPYNISTVGSNFSPSSISSLETWYDASVSTSISSFGSTIAFWQDIGFYGRHLYQSTVINQPKYLSSAIKANNSVFFDGNVRFMNMSTTAGIASNDYTIFVVEQRQTGGANYILGGSNTSNFQNLYLGYSGTSNVYVDMYGSGLSAVVEPYTDSGNRGGIEPTRIWSVHYSLASNYRYMYINGQLLASNALTQDFISWLNPTIGRAWPGGGPYYYNGYIKEIQFYTTALDVPTRQLMEGYLATKWNIQANLMSNTPISTLKNMTNNPVDMFTNATQLFNMPILSSSSLLGGQNIMRFDVNKTLFLGYYNSNAPFLPTISPLQFVLYPMEFSLFYIARHIGSNANNNRIILQGQNVASYFGYTTNKKNYYFLDANIEINGTNTNSNWDMYTFVKKRDGMTSIAYFGSNINTGYTQSGFEGMAINTGNDAVNISDCEVGEILLYDTAFGLPDAARVETYLANKYNLTSNLLQPFSNVPQPLLTNVISSLSTIPDLKFWYDPTQIPIVNHPYRFSSPGTNLSSIPGLDCWFDASGVSNFSTFGSSIGVWFDKGPNGRNLLQSTNIYQPNYISSPTASIAVNFNAARTQFMTFSTVPAVVNSDYTVFLIEQVQSAPGASNMILGGSCNSNFMNLYLGYSFYDVTSVGRFFQTRAGIQGTDIAMNVPNLQQRLSAEPYRIWSFQYSSNLQLRKLFINGYMMGTNTQFTTDLQSWAGASMGRYVGNYYTGNVRELLIYSNYLPDSQRQQVEGYLGWKWSIQGNLNSNTPVSTIKNLAGTGADFINWQGNYCNMPFVSTNPTLGRQVLRFDCNMSMYQCNTRLYTNEFTMFTLSRHLWSNAQSNSRYIFLGLNTGIYGYGPGTNSWSKNYFQNDGNVETFGSPVDSNWNLHRFQRDSNGQGSLANFGQLINRGYLQSGFEGMGINYGAQIGTALTNVLPNVSDCEVGEIIFYDRALTERECIQVEQYIANKYNLGIQYAALSTSAFTVTTAFSTISTLSDITGLRLWFDPTQAALQQHPFGISTVGSNFSPSSISSLDGWFDASLSTNFSTVGSTVAIWYDRGRNQKHLYQLISTFQPRFVSSVITGCNSLFFNGSNQFMTFNANAIPAITCNDYTIIALEQRQASYGGNYFIGGSNTTNFGNLYMGYSGNSNIYTDIYGGGSMQPVVELYNNRSNLEPFRIWCIQYSYQLAVRKIFINGTMMGSNYLTQDLTTWVSSGVGYYNTNFYTGNLKEIMFYTGYLPDDTRQLIEGYLGTKWGIQGNLMSNQPVSTLKNLTGMPVDMLNTTAQVMYAPSLCNSPILGNKRVLRFSTAFSNTLFLAPLNSNNPMFLGTTSLVGQIYPLQYLIYPTEFTLFYLSRHMGTPSNSRYILQGQTMSALYGYGSGYNGMVKNYFTNDGNVDINGINLDSNWNLYTFSKLSNGMASYRYFGSNGNRGYVTSGFEGMSINMDSNNSSDCEVAEILVYNRTLTLTETVRVEQYIANKYALSTTYTQFSTLSYASSILKTPSTLSSIANLKLWFDPSQIDFMRHPYNFSTVGPSFSPSSISSLDCWFEASDPRNYSTVGSTVAAWYDLGSNARHLVQLVSTNQPLFVSSQTKSVNSIYFNGASQFMRFSTPPNIFFTDYTIMILEQRRSATANSYFLGGSNTTNFQNIQFGYNSTSNAYYNVYATGAIQISLEPFADTGGRLTESFRIWAMTYTSNTQTLRMYMNGHLMQTLYPYFNDMTGWIGASVGLFWNGSPYYYNGNVKEIAFFRTALPDDQRQLMEGYLATKWGIQTNLMSNTPVSTLMNLTGMNAHMVTFSNQLCNMPFVSTSVLLGGKNVLRFDSNSKSLFLNYINSNTTYSYVLESVRYPNEFSLFYIARHINSNTTLSRLILQGNANSAYYGYNAAQKKGIFTLDGYNVEINGFAANSNWDMWSFTKSESGMGSIYYFGSNINTAYVGSGFEGMGINFPDITNVSDCEVGEILLYDRFLGSNERNQVENYLANKYSMTSNLLQPFSNVPQTLLTNVISSLSTISDLKFWYDPSQVPFVRHPYNFSTPRVNPSTIPGLDCWFDASGISNFSTFGSSISIWYDKGSNSRHLMQSTLFRMPTYVSSFQTVVNMSSQSAVFLNGTQLMYFSTTPAIVNTDFTIFVVEQRQSNIVNNTTNYMSFLGGSNSNTPNCNFNVGYINNYQSYNNNNFLINANFTSMDFYQNGISQYIPLYTRASLEPYRIWSIQYGSNARIRRFFVNGFLHGNQSNFATDIPQWLFPSLGFMNSNGTSYFYTGNVKEMIFYSNYMGDSQRQDIEGYLGWKWGIQNNLNSNTPVSTLKNLTGTGADLIAFQGALCNYPSLIVNPILQQPVLRFNINTQLYQCNSLFYHSDYTFFVLARQLCGPTGIAGPSNTGANCNVKNFIYGLNFGFFGYGSGYNGYVKNMFNADGTIENYGTIPDSNWDLFRFRRDSDGNGSLHYFGSNVNRGYLQSGFEGFGINFSFGNSQFWQNLFSDGEVGELIFYNRALSINECTRVESYIANKYNLGQRLIQFSTPAVYASTIYRTPSSLSTILNLKLWFDPSQMNLVQHAYRFSTVGSNFSPSSISSLDAWYDASLSTNFTIASGSNISQWRDSSGRGRNIVQSTTSNQPFYMSTLNSISSAVYFNNSNFMAISSIANITSNDYTIFVVEQRQNNSGTNYFMGASSSNATTFGHLQMGYNGTNSVFTDLYNNNLSATIEPFSSIPALEPWRIWCVSYSSNITMRSLFINGQLLNSNFMFQDLLSWSNASIGSFNNGTAYFYTGYMKEIMFFSNALDTSTRELIEGYLATKWNLQNNLTSNTPVSTLKNLTGMPVDMINTSGQLYNMPKLSSSSVLGGRNILRFTACNLQPLFLGFLNSNASNLPTTFPLYSLIYPVEYSLFYIARHVNSNTTFNRHILNGQTQTVYYGYTGQRKSMFFNDGWIELNGATPNSNWDLWSFTRSNDGMAAMFYFGSNINRGYATSGFEGMAINTDSNIASDCEVGEILVYDRCLGPDQRNQVETYLANKYSMTSNLSQPFSNVPQQLLTNVISSLSTIPDLKFWYDPSQVPFVRHPYNFSTPRVNPSTFPGLDCWYDASGASNFNLVASSISIWYDKGSNARHLIQTSAASYPKYFSSINAVNLNNNQFMYFSTTPAVVNTAFTIFVVEQRQSNIANNATNYMSFLGGSNSNTPNCNFNVGYVNNYQSYNNNNFLINANFTNMDFYQNGISQYIPLYTRPSDEPYRIWSIQYSQVLGVRRFFVNGFLHGNQSNFTTNIPQWLFPSLGLLNSNGTSYYYTGNVREMIFYSNFMPDLDRQQVEGYLGWKWGLQSNLNSNTPVSTLKNLTGTGADLIAFQGALCNYPSLIVNPIVQQPVLRFNINTQLYQCNSLFYHSDYTFFVLARQLCGPSGIAGPSNTGANCNVRNFIYGLNFGFFGYGSGYNGYVKNMFNADGTIENYGTIPDSNWDLFRFRRDSDGNGSLHYFASNVNRGYLQSGFEGFGINYSFGNSQFWQNIFSDGEVGELIFYNRALSSNECTRVENYIANKFNLSQRLIQFSSPAVLNTISSLSSISNLKLWFDPSQMNILQHAYSISTVGSNFSPSSISSLDAWYDASISTNITIASGSNVSQWMDSTGRGRTLIQATTGNQPFYTRTVDSMSTSVYFNNSNFLSFTTVPNIISNDYTIFAVEQRQSNIQPNYFMGSASSNTTNFGNLIMGYNASNSAYTDIYNNSLGATIENYVVQPSRFTEPNRIWSVHYSSNLRMRSLFINGQLLNSNFMFQDLVSWNAASIGSFNNGTAYFYTGYIKEILFFSNALDTGTRQLVEGYLATKWNLQSNLMSNTPISTLKNLTGMPIDMINTTGQLFNMPTLSSSALLGGRNVMRFNALRNQPLFLGFINSNASNLPTTFPLYSLIYPVEYTLFYIARHLGCNTTYSRLILQGQTQTAYYGYNTAQKKNMFFNDGWVELNGAIANSNWDLFSFTRSNDGTAAIFYYGSNINRGYATSGFEGMGINTPDTTNVSDCEVGEILVYDRCLGLVERNKVENYLANKYSMTSNLITQAINYPLSVNAAPAAGPSTLSTITNLKFWFDPGQLPLLQHPYKTSSIIGISPSTISNLDCWFDASGANNFTLSVSNVTRWIDKTGRGRDLIQATAGNQPIFSTNTQEVVFTGSGSQFLTFSNIPLITNSDYTIFVLEKRQSNTVPNYFIGGSNTASFTQLYMGYNTTSNFYFDHYNNGTQLTIDNYTSVPQEPYRLWTMAYSSNLNIRDMYLNGIRYMTIATSNDLLSWIGSAVGRFWNGTTYYYTGNVREIIMYNRNLPSSERAVVEGYLARKWNLQSNLTTFTPVSTLRNLTGIGSDFTAQFANPCQLSNMPILNYNTGLGYNTLLFTATTPIRTMQLCNNLLFPTEYTMFTVSRHTPGINKTIFQSITATNTLYGYGVNTSNSTWVKNYFCNDGAVEVFGNPSNTLWDVNTFHRDSNGIATYFYFGSNFNRGYTQSGFEGLSINYGSYDSGCNSASECEVSEILIYDRALVPGEQKSVERYLTNKYGMSTMYNFYTNNLPYTPISTLSTISTLQVWLDASQIVASNGASISTVANFTNLGGLFSNNLGSNYPTLLTNFQNGNSILNFSNTNQMWLTPSRIWQNFSMFSMTRQIGGLNKRVIQGTTGDVAYGHEGGFKNRYYLEQWQYQSMITSDTNWDLNNLIRTSNGYLSTVTWNGSTIVMSNPSTFLGLEGIGFNYCNTAAQSDFQLGELLVYNRPLLYPSEVQAVEGYLARKWATQRFLPVSHPAFLYQLTANNTYTVQASTMSTLCLWLDSAFTSTITTDQTGTTLVRWSDRMGKIASISQATTLYQPNYTTALGPNFCNVDYLDIGQLSSLVVASTFTMLFLERRQSTNTCNMILGGANGTTNNNLQVGYYNTSSFAFSFYNNETTVQVSSFLNTQIEPPRIWSMTYDRQRKFLFMNGGVVSSVQTTTQDLVSYTAPTIGSNAATGTAYNGYLMEALVYSPALSTPALRLAEGYLAWKWGINSFLAPSHPWYSTQPVLPGGGPAYLSGLWAKFYTQTGGPSIEGPTGGGWGTPITGVFTSAPGATLNSNTPGPTNVIWYGNNNGYFPAGNASYSAVYTGFIYSASGGTIQFQFNTDDGMVVFFNGVNVLQSWQGQGDTQYTSGSITLPAGYTPIVSRWYDGGGGGQSILRTNINSGGFTDNGVGRYFYLASNITQT